jgi:hypothetical protein
VRIAFVSTILGYGWGGADTLWTHAAEHALGRGDRVLLAVSPLVAKHPRVQGLRARGADWQPRAAAAVGTRAQRVVRRLAARWRTDPLIGALERFGPNIVVINCGGTGDLVLEPALTAWLRRAQVPFRVLCNWQAENPSLPAADRDLLASIFAAAEAIYFVSSRNLAVTRRWLLLPLPRAAVIQNPVRDSPGGLPLPWPTGAELRLATVSRLAPEKGLAPLLHAVAAALDPTAGWSLEIHGDGPERAHLEATILTLGLGARVRLAGFRPDLDGIWSDHQLLVSPAIDEGVPMTIPEAMLRGRPVLATRVGGAEDWIAAGENGFLCPAATVPLLCESLQTAWAERDRWPALGAAAAAAARARYRPDDYLRLLESCPPS